MARRLPITLILTGALASGIACAAPEWMAQKVRAGYYGVGVDERHPQRLHDHGFNAAWVKMRYGEQYQDEEAHWGKVCHEAGIHYFIVANTASNYEKNLTGYRRAVNKYGEEQETACLRDPAFLRMVFRDRAVSALEAAEENGFELTGFILDPETYGIKGHYGDEVCYCDVCWSDFLEAEGREADKEVAPSERHMWLTRNKLFLRYHGWLEEEWTNAFRDIAAELRERVPHLLLGNFHYRDDIFYRALAKGLCTEDLPTLVCWESTYVGQLLDSDANERYFEAVGANTVSVCGHWVGKTMPEFAGSHCYLLARQNAGYWLFDSSTLWRNWQETDATSAYHLPRPAEEYWAAYQRANEELDRTVADPDYRSELDVELGAKLALPPVPASAAGLAESLAMDAKLLPLVREGVEPPDVDPAECRLSGIYLIHLSEGEGLAAQVHALQVGNYPTNLTWALLDPDGDEVASNLVRLGEVDDLKATAEKTGVYTMFVQVGRNAFKVRFDTPYAVLREHLRGTLWIVRRTPPLYFWVPPDTAKFTLTVKPGGGTEGCNIKVINPDDEIALEQENARGNYEVEVAAEDSAKAWRVEITEPTEGVFEDVEIHLEGCPPYYAYSPEGLLIPGE